MQSFELCTGDQIAEALYIFSTELQVHTMYLCFDFVSFQLGVKIYFCSITLSTSLIFDLKLCLASCNDT